LTAGRVRSAIDSDRQTYPPCPHIKQKRKLGHAVDGDAR